MERFERIEKLGLARRKNKEARTIRADQGPLAVKPKEGFRQRFVSDDPQLQGQDLMEAAEKGWVPVRQSADQTIDTKQITRQDKPGSVVTRPLGGGITGVLMEIPDTVWKENQEIASLKRAKRLARHNSGEASPRTSTEIAKVEANGGFYGSSLTQGK